MSALTDNDIKKDTLKIPLHVPDEQCIQCLVWPRIVIFTSCLLLTCVRWPKQCC